MLLQWMSRVLMIIGRYNFKTRQTRIQQKVRSVTGAFGLKLSNNVEQFVAHFQ